MLAQAALEYLMTYGWALLFLVIVISILIFSGVFSPTSAMRSYCLFPPQMGCDNVLAFQEGNKGHLWLRVINNFGYDIILRKVSVKYRDVEKSIDVNKRLKQGEKATIKILLAESPLRAGEILKFEVLVEVIPCAAEVNPHCSNTGPITRIKGQIMTKVEKK